MNNAKVECRVKFTLSSQDLPKFEKVLKQKMPEQTSHLKEVHLFYEYNTPKDRNCYIAFDWENGDQGSVSIEEWVVEEHTRFDILFEDHSNVFSSEYLVRSCLRKDRNSYMLNGNPLATKVLYILVEVQCYDLHTEVFISEAEAEARKEELAQQYVKTLKSKSDYSIPDFKSYEDVAQTLFDDNCYQLEIQTKILK